MPDRRPRFEPAPLRLLSLSAQFDAVNWPTLAAMTFTNLTGAAVLQRYIDVRPSDDGWTFPLLDGSPLTGPTSPLMEGATQVMPVLTELRSAGRGGEMPGPADV